MSKASRSEFIRRVDIVYRLLLLGLRRAQIIETIEHKYPAWGASSRSVDRYIHEARDLLERAGDYERQLEKGRALDRLHDLYARCVNAKDHRGALAVQHQINELCGLYPPKRSEISITDLSLPDIEAEIARLEAQYAASPDG